MPKRYAKRRCREKTRRGNLYGSLESARSAADEMNGRKKKGRRIEAFRCSQCGWWHIGRPGGFARRAAGK